MFFLFYVANRNIIADIFCNLDFIIVGLIYLNATHVVVDCVVYYNEEQLLCVFSASVCFLIAICT